MSESANNSVAVTTGPPVMAILAGGLATRLHPMTETIPKSMVLVAGEPFLAHQLRMLAARGLREIVILCGFLGEQIVEFAGDGSRFGCNVRYAFDGDVRRGTGGALAHALPLLGETFMVIYGDSFCSTDYLAIYAAFRASGAVGLMTVFHNHDLWDASNVIYQDGRIVRYDKERKTPKMHYIDYGINVFSSAAFLPFTGRPSFDLAELQMDLVARDALAGFEVAERFYEVGSHAGLAETDAFLGAMRSEA
jgi:NDP-sugar pyrophosphorylase family protein